MRLLYTRLLLFLVLCLTSCLEKHEPDVSPIPIASKEALPEEIVTILDNIPSVEVSTDSIILPSGMSVKEVLEKYDPDFLKEYPSGRASSVSANLIPQEKKEMLIARMLEVGANYVNDALHHKDKGTGGNEPEQFGLGYVLGSRSIADRSSARGNNAGTCEDKLYGIDCSGFVHQMLERAGIKGMDLSAEAQANVANWEKALQNATEDLKGINAKHYSSTEMPASKLQAGDFIYWTSRGSGRVTHSGMVLKPVGGTGAIIYQSNGSGSSKCDINYNSMPVSMKDKKRGPRTILIQDIETAFRITRNGPNDDDLLYSGAIRLEADCDDRQTRELLSGGSSKQWKLTQVIHYDKNGTVEKIVKEPEVAKVTVRFGMDGTIDVSDSACHGGAIFTGCEDGPYYYTAKGKYNVCEKKISDYDVSYTSGRSGYVSTRFNGEVVKSITSNELRFDNIEHKNENGYSASIYTPN